MGNRIRQRRSENSISRGLGSPHSMIGPPRAGLLSVLRTGYVVSRYTEIPDYEAFFGALHQHGPPLICEFRLWFPFVTEFPFVRRSLSARSVPFANMMLL
ncbi:hypothetical protein CTAM01_13290 [Colletotrichum tamarilloi]|uniref:Uncharacterized protein n=1 Tax=Colletotrichum tamarilloi TaxID=1209934 RepID=A0ABQ9QSH7_9PEZI|nr:uncharacterized protein CTAM01_13290 [Colletotrichum tamarilloi]KAK1483670.1 hypothetical protein CTAM01_13290 [Colletotrichum tamarilloi]